MASASPQSSARPSVAFTEAFEAARTADPVDGSTLRHLRIKVVNDTMAVFGHESRGKRSSEALPNVVRLRYPADDGTGFVDIDRDDTYNAVRRSKMMSFEDQGWRPDVAGSAIHAGTGVASELSTDSLSSDTSSASGASATLSAPAIGSSLAPRGLSWQERNARDIESQLLAFEATQEASLTDIVYLYNGDCVEAAQMMMSSLGCRTPAVLNMACETTPGGGYRSGAGAQEENLHRRSNLFQHLEDPDGVFSDRDWHYPLPTFGGVISPEVLFIRGSEARGYPLLAKPFKLPVVTVAAVRRPSTLGEGPTQTFTIREADNVKRKMRAIFELALAGNCDSIVLSAFGCGAFRNPPQAVARCFREVIVANRYQTRFRAIAFAIFDDHNSGKQHNPLGNFAPFKEAFSECSILSGELPSDS